MQSTQRRLLLGAAGIEKVFILTVVTYYSILQTSASDKSVWLTWLAVCPRELFALHLLWSGIQDESIYAFLAFGFVQLELVYQVIASVIQLQNSVTTFQFCAAGFVLLWQFLYIVLILAVSENFGWKFFKIVGADLNFLAMFENYLKVLTLLKVDLQIVFRMLIISVFIYIKYAFDNVYLYASISYFIAEFLWNIVFRFSIINEWSSLTRVSLILGLCSNAFLGLMYWRYKMLLTAKEVYAILFGPMIAVALSRLLIFYFGLIAERNFHKGLKEKVYGKLFDSKARASPLIAKSPVDDKDSPGSSEASEADAPKVRTP